MEQLACSCSIMPQTLLSLPQSMFGRWILHSYAHTTLTKAVKCCCEMWAKMIWDHNFWSWVHNGNVVYKKYQWSHSILSNFLSYEFGHLWKVWSPPKIHLPWRRIVLILFVGWISLSYLVQILFLEWLFYLLSIKNLFNFLNDSLLYFFLFFHFFTSICYCFLSVKYM